MTDPTIRIRGLALTDLDIAVAIHEDAFGVEAWDRKAIAEIMAMPGAVGRLAFDDRADAPLPLGFALILLVASDAELLTLAVAHRVRRLGVGTMLLQDFFHQALRVGATNAFLEVAEDNIPAQCLYARLGFRKEGMRRDYYRRPGNKRIAAHLLRRPLP
ncbi:MAG TPA: GNAT family N-acetyltransferase [Aliidongia sp.]|nr:GNAT family N-acetyltransferase [Aliidongia sp.]